MKKLFVIAAMAAFSFANAQKGTILVGGNVGFTSEKQDFGGATENKVNNFEFSPKVGYQFTDNWTAGIEAGIGSSKTENTDVNEFGVITTENKNKAFSAGAFVRYTRPLSETFSVFADLGAGFQGIKQTGFATDGTITVTNPERKASGFYVGVTPAIFINVKKGFGLNFNIGGLGYQTMNYDNNGGDNSAFYFNFGQTLNIGISKNF